MSALTTWLTAIADAIRGKDGTALPIDHIDFPAKIAAIPQLDTSDATALVTDILAPKTAYVDGEKITGTCTYDADTSSGDAVAADIALGKKAWVDGAEVVGSSTKNADTTDATAVANSLLYGHTAYGADGTKLTGTGAYWQYVKSFSFGGANSAPGNVEIYAPLAVLGAYAFLSNTAITSLTLTYGSMSASTSRDCFNGCTNLVSISTLNFTGAANVIGFFANCTSLVTVVITPSTISLSIGFASSPLLSTASLLSIANGLVALVEPRTLTMHADSKTNMDAINVDVVDGVAILGTTKTLTQFITTDKGWTIA